MFRRLLPKVPLALLIGSLALAACSDEARNPEAVITGPTEARIGEVVQLDGTPSDDPEGDVIAYEWRLAQLPAESQARFNDVNLARPSFTPDEPGSYVIELVVYAGVRQSAPASHVVSVGACGDSAPEVASISAEPAAPTVGNTVRVSADVADADNTAGCDLDQFFTYKWELMALPTGSQATLNDARLPSPSFVADASGTYTVAVTVSDSAGLISDQVTFDIVVSECGEARPTVIATADPADPAIGETVVFSATGDDADNAEGCGAEQTLTYAWTLVEAPAASAVALQRPDLAQSWLTPDVAGDYIAAVRATDSTGRTSDPAIVTVTAVDTEVGVTVTAEPLTGLAPLTVDFSCTATGDAPIRYAWSFGTGAVSTLQNPSFTYSGAGFFTATCLAIDVNGDSSTASIDITVNADTTPTVEASADPPVGVAPLDVQFSALVTGGEGEIAYAWDFGDGKTSTDPAPTNTFEGPGLYPVVVRVTDEDGDSSTDLIEVAVADDDTPAVAVAANPETGISPLFVQLQSFTAGGNPPYTFAWTFGDGEISTLENPSHTYVSGTGETFTAELTVTDVDGDVALADVDIVVEADVAVTSADATATPAVGRVPLLVGFVCDADGGNEPLEYSWSFGDGGTSTDQSPAHIYRDANVYTATCTVTDADGDVRTDSVTVTAELNRVPSVALSANVTRGVAPQVVTFQATTSGGDPPLVLDWDFGDGTTEAGGGATETRTYGAGTYQIGVVAVDVDGDTDRATITISVDPDGPDMEVIALADPRVGVGSEADPVEVSFSALVSGGNPPYSYTWDFDGAGASALASPTVALTPAVYDVTVVVTDADGDRSDPAGVQVTVLPDESPVAGPVTATDTSPLDLAPLLVDFTCPATGGNPPLSFAWSFGDGQSSTLQNPSHTYAAAGSYTATCTVTDVDGDADSDSVTRVAVADTVPQPTIVGGPLVGLEGLLVDLNSTVVGGNGTLSYAWDFGDPAIAGFAAANPPVVEYETPGTFTVVLRVTDQDGDAGEDTVTVVVGTNETPTVDIQADVTTGVAPLTVNFTATVAGGNGESALSWDLDDDNVRDDSIAANPSFTYGPGIFVVTVRATDEDGSIGEDTIAITVAADLDITAVTATHAVAGNPLRLVQLTATFNCVATGGNPDLSYSWRFGDGGTSTQQMTTHTYVAPGTYDAVCTVTDADGDAESGTTSVEVNADTAPVVSISATPAEGSVGPDGVLTVLFESEVTGGNGGLAYSWNVDNAAGEDSDEPSFEFDYTVAEHGPLPRSFNVTLDVSEVDDDDGGSASTTVVVRPYTMPTIVASAVPSSGVTPLTVNLFANTAGGEGPLSFEWDFTNDGTTDSTTQNPTFVYPAGSFTARVTVTDSLDGTATSTVGITVAADDEPDVTLLVLDTDRTRAPVTAAFECQFASDNGPNTLQWVFGDGQTATVENATNPQGAVHTYGVAGSYAAQCIVTDGDGDLGTATQTIDVGVNSLPNVTLAASPQTGIEPLAVIFTASTTGGNPVLEYDWDFGDGTVVEDGGTAQSHTYAAGTYVARVTVCDDDPDCDSDAIAIQVDDDLFPVVVTAARSPASGEAPVMVQFSANASGGNAPYTFAWDFGTGAIEPDCDIGEPGNGAKSGLQNPTFTYATDGTFTAAVVATDADGDSGCAEVIVTVTPPNRAPVAIATENDGEMDAVEDVDICLEGFPFGPDTATFDLTAAESGDPEDDLLTYQWTFTNVPPDAPVPELEPNASVRDVSFQTSFAGEYSLVLTVSDGELIDTDEIIISYCASVEGTTCDALAGGHFQCIATCGDGVQNQGETDVDCGGAACPGTCEFEESCAVVEDCVPGLLCDTVVPGQRICHENVWFVDNSTDIDGVRNGVTWGTALSDLQQALILAGSTTPPGEVWVADGVYVADGPNGFLVTANETRLYGGFTGFDEDEEAGPEDRNGGGVPDPTLTILEGNACFDPDCAGDGCPVACPVMHVLSIDGFSEVTVDGFTIRNGFAPGFGVDSTGGGIYANGALGLTLANLHVRDNGGHYGAGAFFRGANDLLISNALFADNIATAGGGAIYMDDSVDVRIEDTQIGNAEAASPFGNLASVGGGLFCLNVLDLVVEDSIIGLNAASNHGGGVHLHCESATFDGVRIQDNDAGTTGGGVYAIQAYGLHIESSQFFGNDAEEHGGGAAIIESNVGADPVTITATEFASNDAIESGGGLYILDSDFLRIEDIVGLPRIGANMATSGGGIYIEESDGVVLSGVRIDSNITDSRGGGVTVRLSDDLFINDVDFEGNDVLGGGIGGGLWVEDSDRMILLQSAFLWNTAGFGGAGAAFSLADDTQIGTTLFQDNSGGINGGGLYFESSLNLSINASMFELNDAASGGGMFLLDMVGVSVSESTFGRVVDDWGNVATTRGGGIATLRAHDLELDGTDFYENLAPRGAGAAFSDSLRTDVTDAIVARNVATDAGGGFLGESLAQTLGPGDYWIDVQQSSFTDNEADRGGALYLDDIGATVSRTSFVGNRAMGPSGSGGAVYQLGPDDTQPQSLFVNDVFSQNYASNNGGGVLVHNAFRFVALNSTSWGDSADIGGDAVHGISDVSAPPGAIIFTLANILLRDCPDAAGPPGCVGGTGQVIFPTEIGNGGGADPNSGCLPSFVDEPDPADVGGAFDLANGVFDDDFDLRLIPGADVDNDCIDEGSGNPGGVVAAPPVDFEGVPRPQGATFDLGAFEFLP